MERARSEAQPKVPKTLEKYAGNLVDERYRQLFLIPDGSVMFKKYIKGVPEVWKAVICLSPKLKTYMASILIYFLYS